MLDLSPGTAVLSPHGRAFVVDADLAAAYRPGDRLVANDVAGLLHVPAG